MRWREWKVEKRIENEMVKGIKEYIEEDKEEERIDEERKLNVIEGKMMEGMNVVGEMLG